MFVRSFNRRLEEKKHNDAGKKAWKEARFIWRSIVKMLLQVKAKKLTEEKKELQENEYLYQRLGRVS